MNFSKKTVRLFLFFLSIVLVMIGQGIVIPIVTELLTLQKASPLLVGIIVSAYSLGSLLFSPFIGNYINRTSSKNILQYSLIFYFITLLLLFSTTNIFLIICLRFIGGILMAATFAAVEIYISKNESLTEQSKLFLIISSANSIGMSIGPIIGTIIVYTKSPFLLYSLGFLSIVLSILVHFSLNEVQKQKSNSSQNINLQVKTFFNELLFLFQDPKTLYALTSFAVFGFITNSFEGFGLSFLINKYSSVFQNYNLTFIILEILLLVILALFYIFLINPILLKKYSPFESLIASSLISSANFFLMIFNINLYLFIIIVTLSFLGLVIFSNSIILYLSLSGPNKGLVLGVKNSAMGFGAIIGPIVSGMVYSINSSLFIVFIGAILILISAWGMILLKK